MTTDQVGGVASEAISIIEKTLNALAAAHGAVLAASNEPQGRLFFPNGIELVYFKFNLGKDVDIQIALAGEKAKYPSGSSAADAVIVGDASGVSSVSSI